MIDLLFSKQESARHLQEVMYCGLSEIVDLKDFRLAPTESYSVCRTGTL